MFRARRNRPTPLYAKHGRKKGREWKKEREKESGARAFYLAKREKVLLEFLTFRGGLLALAPYELEHLGRETTKKAEFILGALSPAEQGWDALSARTKHHSPATFGADENRRFPRCINLVPSLSRAHSPSLSLSRVFSPFHSLCLCRSANSRVVGGGGEEKRASVLLRAVFTGRVIARFRGTWKNETTSQRARIVNTFTDSGLLGQLSATLSARLLPRPRYIRFLLRIGSAALGSIRGVGISARARARFLNSGAVCCFFRAGRKGGGLCRVCFVIWDRRCWGGFWDVLMFEIMRLWDIFRNYRNF